MFFFWYALIVMKKVKEISKIVIAGAHQIATEDDSILLWNKGINSITKKTFLCYAVSCKLVIFFYCFSGQAVI